MDLTGRRFGRLLVLERAGRINHKHWWWCLCDCGKRVEHPAAELNKGRATSCGCLRIEKLRLSRTKHSFYGLRVYRTWKNIKTRCGQPSSKWYRYYGAKGIKVCDEWQDAFTFIRWAIANGYSDCNTQHIIIDEDGRIIVEEGYDDLTIDRRDPDKDYEPSNCFITSEENSARALHPEQFAPAPEKSQWM